MRYLKSFDIFINENTLTYDSILSNYGLIDLNDYKSKFIITKFLEYYMSLNKDNSPLGLDSLNKYSSQIFTKENIEKIEQYKKSDWISAIDLKLDPIIVNYPNLVNDLMRKSNVYDFAKTGLVTTNIKVFRVVLNKLNSILPKEIKFNFKFKGLVEITDKNFLKLLLFYKDQIFSENNFKEYIGIMNNTLNYAQKSEEAFLEYLKGKGISARKANLQEDIKGIDIVDSEGITYQVKAPINFKIYRTGYFIDKSSQLDIRKLKEVDKLALYLNGKLIILNTNDVDFEQKEDGGLFIKILF